MRSRDATPKTPQPARSGPGVHVVQRKLRVGAADDAYEREADAVAAQVVAKLRAGSASGGAAGTVNRSTTASADQAVVGRDGGDVDGALASELRSTSGGAPLDADTSAQMGSALDADFSSIRVHTDSNLAPRIGASAFTYGQHIHFAPGAYAPDSSNGIHTLAHELTHTVQQGAVPRSRDAHRAGPVQRRMSADTVPRLALSPNEVAKAVLKIPFVKQKLGEKLQFDGTSRTSEVTVEKHVMAVIAQYKKNLAGADKVADEVMALSLVVDALGQVLALNVLNDPALAPKLAAEFLTVYGTELKQKLSKSEDVDRTIDAARAVVSDDPIRLYLHDELRVDYAARRIRMMASAAGKEPAAMFTLLRGRFEVDMAARSKTTIGKEQDSQESYNVGRSTGEMTAEWFSELFVGNDTAQWKDAPGGRQLDYTPATQQRLDALELEVKKPPEALAASGDRAGVTWKQAQHLNEVDAADKKKNDKSTGGADIEAVVAAALEKVLPKLQPGEGMKVTQKVRAGLGSLPLTITVPGDGWFGSMDKAKSPGTEKDKSDFDYGAGSSRKNTTSYDTIFGKQGLKGDVKHYGQWKKGPNDKQERTANYFRFRGWKDQVMTGRRGLSAEELPVFGAVNPNWEGAHGAENPTIPVFGGTKGVVGENSYGNVHWVINPAKVKGRVVYTATDHGEPHTDPFLAFADFLLAGKADTRTKLKDVAASTNHIALNVVNAILLGKQAEVVAISNQAFEVQIFGGLNMIEDSLEVWYAPNLSPPAVANMKLFEKKFGTPVKAVADPPSLNVGNNMQLRKEKAAFVKKLQTVL